jgi:hypothetical protein
MKSLSPTKEGSSKKRKREKKRSKDKKGKEVKPHLPIQGHEKLHEKKEKKRG